MKQTLRIPKVRIIIAAALSLVSVCAAAAAVPATAATPCEHYTAHATAQIGQSGVYYTAKHVVPSNSTCHDINIQSATNGVMYNGWHCLTMRVRFYPTNATSYANAWTMHCMNSDTSNQPLSVIASNVLNGTTYRIEIAGSSSDHINVLD